MVLEVKSSKIQAQLNLDTRKGLNIITKKTLSWMTLHKHTLSLNLSSQINDRIRCPHIDQVIRKTIDQQIHQHVKSTPMRHQHLLIERTKQLLKSSTHKDRYNIVQVQSRRCGTSAFQQRRDGRLNQTKRQLQMLSQLYKDTGKDQVKRYREQIEHEESEIKATIAKYNLKRAYLSTTAKPNKTRTIRQTLATSRNQGKEEPKKKDTKIEETDIQFAYDRFQPYRRMLLNRRKSKAIVSPWNMSQPTQPN